MVQIWQNPLVRVALIAALLGAAVARADDSPRRRLMLEEEHVPGKVQRPEVTIFVSRQNLRPDVNIVLKETFIPKIVESAEVQPL